MPGPAPLWVLGAGAVFIAAIVIAFVLNGDDEAASAVVAPVEQETPGDQTPAAQQQQAQAAAQQQAGDTPASDESPQQQAEVSEAPDAQQQAAEDGQQAQNEAEEEPEQEEQAQPLLTDFVLPIDGACLTEFPGHLPGAPRDYRNGIHEGFDFYGFASCSEIDGNTAILAARAGSVIRADRIYEELSLDEYLAAEAEGFAGEEILDRFRGRQVWIDHGAGVVTRYAHMGAIAAGIEQGVEVRAGQVIGFVGESGTPESIFSPGTDLHLHFEIRIDDGYLGEGLAPEEARALYAGAFGIQVAEAP